MFNTLNDLILEYNKRIMRRTTKKEIVYKKDKCKNIISIIITKKEGLKVFVNKEIVPLDTEKRFFTISKNNRKVLENCIKINEEDDLNYIKLIIIKYLDKVL